MKNKKGFTLVEVIVSIVLVSVVMVSMLASLTKLRDTYTVIHENSDVLVYTSSIARVINNDLMKNNGIRYSNCSIDGKKCDLILGNDEKRSLEILEEGIGEDLGDYKDPCKNQDITHEKVTTTLRYLNTTKNTEKLIYIRTLILDRYTNNNTNVVTTNGYNFYDMNVEDSRLYYKDGSSYVDAISNMNIRIWDGKSSESTKYDISLYSSGRYDESELIGKSYRISLDTDGANNTGTAEIDEVFGVAYFNSKKVHSNSDIIKRITKPTKVDTNGEAMAFLGYYYYKGSGDAIGIQVIDSKGTIVSSSRLFRNDIVLVDLAGLTEEEKLNHERVVAKWAKCTNGYKVVDSECVPEQYKVTLNKNGGSGGSDYYNATYKALVPSVSIPSKTGYTFDGYHYGTVEYNDSIGLGKVLYDYTHEIAIDAKWNKNTYTVAYAGNTSNGGSTASQSCVYDEDFTIATNGYSKTGWHFASWNTQTDGSGTTYTQGQTTRNLNSVNNGTTTLYAIWERNDYKVTFNANGGTGSMSDQSFKYGIAQNLTENGFSRTGYQFNKWKDVDGNTYNDKASVNNLTTTNNGTVTLTAQWLGNSYTIEYAGMSDATFGSNHPTSARYGTSFTVNNPSKAGYVFDGWKITGMDSVTHTYGSNTTTATSISSTTATTFNNLRSTSGTVTFTAQWTKAQVTFDTTDKSFEDLNAYRSGQYWKLHLHYEIDYLSSTKAKVRYKFMIQSPVGWIDDLVGDTQSIVGSYGSSPYGTCGKIYCVASWWKLNSSSSWNKIVNYSGDGNAGRGSFKVPKSGKYNPVTLGSKSEFTTSEIDISGGSTKIQIYTRFRPWIPEGASYYMYTHSSYTNIDATWTITI